MKKNKRFRLDKFDEGFSLTEVLIWAGIVGIFVGLVGIAGSSFINKAKVSGAKIELQTFSAALIAYKESVGKYPTQDEGLAILIKGNYITPTDLKDPWKNNYNYTLLNDGEDFVLTSYGADKREGGKGVKKDIVISSSNQEESITDNE